MEPNKSPNQNCHCDKLNEPLKNVAHFLEDLIKALCIVGNQRDDVAGLDTREVFKTQFKNLKGKIHL